MTMKLCRYVHRLTDFDSFRMKVCWEMLAECEIAASYEMFLSMYIGFLGNIGRVCIFYVLFCGGPYMEHKGNV